MDKAWEFMKQYQEENSRPASLSEIAAAVPELNYRSSASHRLKTLQDRGLVMEIGQPGSARRMIAVEPIDHKLPFTP